MLPFGLRLAPKIFNAVADALNWYLHQCGIPHVLHYLDDFIIIGPPGSPICQESMSTLDRVCAELGIPIAEHKRDGPSTCIVFLGIEIDTIAGNSAYQQTNSTASRPFFINGVIARPVSERNWSRS